MSDHYDPFTRDSDREALDRIEPPCPHEFGHTVCLECGLSMPTPGRHGIDLDPETAFD